MNKKREAVDPETGELSPVNSKGKPLDSLGREIPDPVPLAPPVGYKRSPTLQEQIKRMVQSERLAQLAQESGHETFAEAEDFDVGDDYDPRSPWEDEFEGEPVLNEIREEVAKKKAEAEAVEANKKLIQEQEQKKPAAD